MKKVAVLGYGTVGTGVVELLDNHCEMIREKTGEEFVVKYILDILDFPEDKYKDKHVKDFNMIVNDPEIDIVVEVIGGATVAYEFTKQSLEAGKHVVTSNKELVSKKGPELLKIAKEHGVKYLFEASVGGGIPILHPLMNCLETNDIYEIVGILNGTTNYILTRMIKGNKTFQEALKEAQDLGYAESNPAADVEGKDACRKISILGSLVLGKYINPDKIYTRGITDITLKDLEKAEKQGYVIKLLGFYRKQLKDKIQVFVSPCAVAKSHLFSRVNDVFNEVIVKGDCTGEVAFYGKGAGKFPTASAVCSDIIKCTKNTVQPKIETDCEVEIELFESMKFEYIEGTNIPILK